MKKNVNTGTQKISFKQMKYSSYVIKVLMLCSVIIFASCGNGVDQMIRVDQMISGSVWTQATANAGWTVRRIHTSVVFDNKLWVIGGYDGNGTSLSSLNDVWYAN